MHLISTISSGLHQISPRIGILGQHSYKPEERGLTDEATDSVANQVKRIEDSLVLGYDIMNAYKQESATLRVDIEKLLNNLMDKNEDALQEVQPDLIDDYYTMKSHSSELKDENEALYKQLLSLKKET